MSRTFFQIFENPLLVFSILYLPLLASCGDDEADIAAAQEEALIGNKIECALNGADVFSASCATQRLTSENGTILMIRHADGGFKRFNILTDGRGLETAEGYDDSHIEIIDKDYIILTSGNDKYRLKAQFKGGLTRSNTAPVDENLSKDDTTLTTDDEAQNNIPDSEVGPIGTPGAPYRAPQ